MPFINIVSITGTMLLVLMTMLWLISLRLNNASIVDVFWGIGFMTCAWLTYLLAPQGYLPRKLLICGMTTLWGLRLAFHIGARNWNKPEDYRYVAWRTTHGARWPWMSFFQVFLLQGFLIWIISMPILAAQTSGFPAILTPLDLIGGIFWAFGLVFESIADFQLVRFKRDKSNKGAILTSGVWAYSRHPNYFGEAMVWWGFYLIAAAAGYGWLIHSPIIMTWLLVRVSGVAMLERSMKLKPGYEEYMRRTSAFIPWFRKAG